MSFEEETAENVFCEGFLVIFCLHMGRRTRRTARGSAPGTATGRRRQLLALHVCRRIRGVIDGRAETKTRALFDDRSDPRCLSSRTNSFPWPLSLRVAHIQGYECISRPRQHRGSVRSQQGLIFDVETAKSGSPEADKGDRQPRLSREIKDLSC